MSTSPSTELATFVNPKPERAYEIEITVPEFTCLCPITGQPDFAVVRLRYIPDARCLELKALKLYFWSFRDQGHFHEAITNRIVDDLVEAVQPRAIEVEAVFNIRGGIETRVVARAGNAATLSVATPLRGLGRG
jgi:7-cyano-7-deazaguanine reductase